MQNFSHIPACAVYAQGLIVNQPTPLRRLDERMTPDITPRPWTKAIPESRDRLQSRILVWIAVPILCYLAFSLTHSVISEADFYHLLLDGSRLALLRAAVVSLIFASAAWRLRAATPLGAACGGLMCLLVMEFSQRDAGSSILHSGLSPLVLLFALTFGATRLGRARKATAGLAESRKGRNAAQVIANLGLAAVFSSPLSMIITGWVVTVGDPLPVFGYSGREGHLQFMQMLWLPMLAALAEATADTVSSEIGQAFGGTPRIILTLRRVTPGTDGAVTLYGTLAGIAGAAIIAATGMPALGMSPAECAVAFAAGVAGLFFDSLLGATVERKGWIGNDLVNFFSTAFAAAVSLIAIRFAQQTLLR
jgi:uncharacterized protein (TIGR00297 family)